jgi:hypothetical protein
MNAETSARSPDAMQHVVLLRRAGAVRETASVTVPALRCTARALHRVRDTSQFA